MSFVEFESANNVSYIYLNRPERYNALNKQMLEELLEVIKRVEENKDRIVVLTGKGKAFSAGGDMEMLKDFAERELYDQVISTIEQIVTKLYMMPKLVVSAINGPVAGLGLSIALAADYVLTDAEAKIGVLFLGVGLAPDGGGHFWLEERLGIQGAKQFMWSMERVTGKQAYEMGLVDLLVEADVLEEAEKLADQLNHSPLEAMLATKLAYHEAKLPRLKYYLNKERENQWKLRQTKDHAEGVSAFLEKRKANFTGE